MPSFPAIANRWKTDLPGTSGIRLAWWNTCLSPRRRNYIATDKQWPGRLYNPFWRWLGEQQTLAEEHSGRLAAGTHFFRSDQLSSWFTFDQALVSGSLLGGNGWVLSEEGTGICPFSLLLKDGQMVAGFDHLPIVVTLVQEAKYEEISK